MSEEDKEPQRCIVQTSWFFMKVLNEKYEAVRNHQGSVTQWVILAGRREEWKR